MRWILALLLSAGCGVGVASPFDGPLWIADPQRGAVSLLDHRGSMRSIIDRDSTADPNFSPSALALLDGRLLVTDFATGDLLSFDPSGKDPRLLHENGPSGPRLEEPCAIQIVGGERGDEIWVLGNDSRNLIRFDADGGVIGEIGASEPIRNPHSFDLGPDGQVVFGLSPSSPERGLVQTWDLHSDTPTHDFAQWPALEEATGVLVAGDRLLVTDWFGGRIASYALDGSEEETLVDGVYRPVSTALAPDGTLIVLTSDAILRFDTDGNDLGPLYEAPGGTETLAWARNLLIP